MKSIEYVSRANAGGVFRGSVSEGDEVTVIPAANGQEISLNLRQIDIEGYQRDGGNLILSLADGRIIVLEGYFGPDGAADSRLFISADGYLNEVSLVEGSEGTLYAQYGPTEMWGKWSPSDDLIFLGGSEVAAPAGAAAGEEVSMLGAGLLGLGGSGLMGAAGVGAAGLAATSLLASGGGSDGGMVPTGPTRNEPVVNEEGAIVIGGDDETDPSITITGEAAPGSDVEVTIGDKTVDTTANDDGEWEAIFDGDDFPEDGEYDVTVVVTEPDGTETTLDGPSITIDTTPPEVDVTEGLVSNDHIVNDDDFRDGVEIAGTGEVGATVAVTIDDVTETTVVGEDGTWRVEFDAADLREGDYETDVTIVSSDQFGNSSSVTETISIDTIYNDLEINANQVGDNGLVNKDWADNEGLVVTGVSEPGATVVVSMGGQSTTVTAGNDGTWEAEFDPYALPDTQYDATVTARTVDEAGNVTEKTETIRVDLEVRNFTRQADIGGSDGVINENEIGGGFSLSGTVEDGSSTVTLKFFDEVVEAKVNADGTWTASFSGDQIPPGDYSQDVQIIAQDSAGNVKTLTQTVVVDTEAGSLTLNGNIGNNGVINHDVYENGVMVTGTADPYATVVVSLGDVQYTVQADQNGNWQKFYDTSDLPSGITSAELKATITDEHENTYSVSEMVAVDTVVENLSLEEPAGMPATAEGISVINQNLANGGFELTGTVEKGSQVWVEIDGVPGEVTINQQTGEWTAVFDSGTIPGGTRHADMVVRVQDANGNLDELSQPVLIDTEVKNLAQGETVGAVNGFANLDAARDGLELTGTVEPGSEVEVEIFGKTYFATGDSSGAWSITVPRGDIPNDEGTAEMSISGTDIYGNFGTATGQVAYDMVAPGEPLVQFVGEELGGGGGYSVVGTDASDDSIAFHQIDDGGVTALDVTGTPVGSQTYHTFVDGSANPAPIPDGSQLLVTSTDQAGNASTTYLVLDEVSATDVDLTNPALDGFNIETIDLSSRGASAELTITEEQLLALSDNSDTLTVRGGSDDTLTIQGAQKVTGSPDEPEGFDIYTLGDDATIVVDEDIKIFD